MRKHITLLTATLAAVFTMGGTAFAATAASASASPVVGAPVGTLDQAGYQATGRDYRYAQATITVPDLPSASGQTSPQTDTCTVGAAPTFTVTVTYGTATATDPALGLTDGPPLFGSDYTLSAWSPASGSNKVYTATVTLVGPTHAIPAGSTITAHDAHGGSVVVGAGPGATFTVPTEKCGALSYGVDASAPVTITDVTKTSPALKGGTDYANIGDGDNWVTLIDSGAWSYGDTLSVAYTAYKSFNFSPAEYVELGSSTDFARIGITDDHNGSWEIFAATGNTTLFGQHVVFRPLPGLPAGDGVTVSVYYNVSGNELFFNATDPNPAHLVNWAATARAHGAIYTSAAALDDWDFTSTGTPLPLAPWVAPFTINHFLGVAFTTESGARGSAVGPWTTSEVEATSNGLLFPSGTVRVQPSALSSDGIKVNGTTRADDAFTVNAVG